MVIKKDLFSLDYKYWLNVMENSNLKQQIRFYKSKQSF